MNKFFAQTAPQITISPKDVGLDKGPQSIQADNIEQLLMYVYMVAGMVAVIVIIIGGIRYATSTGDSSSVQSAKNTIQYAVVGLIVVIMAAAITGFVIQNIAK